MDSIPNEPPTGNPDPPPLMSVQAASAALATRGISLSDDVLYSLIKAGEFPHVRVHRRIFVPAAQLDRWVDGNWTAPGTQAGAPAAQEHPAMKRAPHRPAPPRTTEQRLAAAFRLLARAQERAADLLDQDGWTHNELDEFDPHVSAYDGRSRP